MPLINRFFSSALTLLLMGLFIFILLDLLPGDSCSAMLGQDALASTLGQCRQRLGLDLPAWQRLLQWLQNLMAGNTGISLSRNREAWEVLQPRLLNTLLLAFMAGAGGFTLAITAGLSITVFYYHEC